MIRNIHGVPQRTLEDYESQYGDRHLLHELVAYWARRTPDQVALVDAASGKRITYEQMDKATDALARALVETGFEPGDFLATILPLSIEHVLLEYACFRIGVVHAPLDLRLKQTEIIRLLQLIQCKGLAFGEGLAGDRVDELARVLQTDCPSLSFVFLFDTHHASISGAIAFDSFLEDALSRSEADGARPENSTLGRRYSEIAGAVRPTDGAQAIFTTGSTGLPKPALLSHRNITCQNMCLTSGFEISTRTRMLVNLPPSHVGCQGIVLMSVLFEGGTAVLLSMFDAEGSLRAVEEYGVNRMGQVPTMFSMQWRLENYEQFDLSTVDATIFSGQSATEPWVEELVAKYPRCGTGLGLTEMAGFVTYTGLQCDVDRLAGTVGWSMPVTPVTIREPIASDGTAGRELPNGEAGEICFSGPQVFMGYVNNPEAYQQTVTPEGICYTGDLGAMTDRGLVLHGRSKLVMMPKGYQVHPSEVENHFAELREHVGLCAAVAAPHQVFGEAIVLFVELKTGATLTREQLRSHAQGIAAYMRPLHFVLMTPDEFPLNRLAKPDYVRLKQMAAAAADALRAEGQWDT